MTGFWSVLWRGLLMGAADIVPGVSGGTVALITGIYQRLIAAVKDALAAPLRTLKQRSATPLKNVDYAFFAPLLLGIAAAFAIALHTLPHLLDTYPAPTYAAFTGLILASAYIVYRRVEHWNTTAVALLILGAILAALATQLPQSTTAPNPWIFLPIGAAAATALLLPGVSGSYVVLLFGQYAYLLGAAKQPLAHTAALAAFLAGGLVGAAALTNLVHHALEKRHDETMGLLTGLMIGGLLRPGTIAAQHTTSNNAAITLAVFILSTALVITLEKIR